MKIKNHKTGATKLVLGEKFPIYREGLAALIDKEDNLELAGAAEDGHTVVRLAKQTSPDVVIINISMPGLNGIEATRQIIDANPDIKVIALTSHSERQFVWKMLSAGARGYLLKNSRFIELILAIHTVVSNRYYLSPAITDMVVTEFANDKYESNASVFSRVSPREREVLQLLTEGRTTKEIAATLNVSVKTIETHRSRIMDKLDIHSVAELTKFAIREGITSLYH